MRQPPPPRLSPILRRDAKPLQFATETRQNNFGSKVSTANPFSGSETRQALNVRPAYTGQDQSRSAFARALADSHRNETRQRFNDTARQFQQEAEQTRARDTLSRREDALNRYQMENEKRVGVRQQNIKHVEGMADLSAYLNRAKQDARANTIGNVATLAVTAALLPFSAPASAMYAAAKGAGGAMSNTFRTGTLGLLGGLRG
jgi:hypothetical protein